MVFLLVAQLFIGSSVMFATRLFDSEENENENNGDSSSQMVEIPEETENIRQKLEHKYPKYFSAQAKTDSIVTIDPRKQRDAQQDRLQLFSWMVNTRLMNTSASTVCQINIQVLPGSATFAVNDFQKNEIHTVTVHDSDFEHQKQALKRFLNDCFQSQSDSKNECDALLKSGCKKNRSEFGRN